MIKKKDKNLAQEWGIVGVRVTYIPAKIIIRILEPAGKGLKELGNSC